MAGSPWIVPGTSCRLVLSFCQVGSRISCDPIQCSDTWARDIEWYLHFNHLQINNPLGRGDWCFFLSCGCLQSSLSTLGWIYAVIILRWPSSMDAFVHWVARAISLLVEKANFASFCEIVGYPGCLYSSGQTPMLSGEIDELERKEKRK